MPLRGFEPRTALKLYNRSKPGTKCRLPCISIFFAYILYIPAEPEAMTPDAREAAIIKEETMLL